MSNKVAVITGISGGLAQNVALTMIDANYNIAAINRNSYFDFYELKKAAAKKNVAFNVYTADLAYEDSIINVAQQLLNNHQQIDVLIHLAGISFSGMSWKQSGKDWKEVLDINLTGPMLLSKHLIPQMKKQKDGVIIYFSSIVAHRPIAGTSAYAASKAGLEGLTKTQSVELGASNIRVNCIAPGYFDAGMIREINEELRNELISITPLKSLGNPQAIAETVLYLCGDGGKFTTGQIFHINGGLYI
ncbi:MAG: SDR family NAD(P)-dependent oxidoreductase [Bacteroidota bacterium]